MIVMVFSTFNKTAICMHILQNMGFFFLSLSIRLVFCTFIFIANYPEMLFPNHALSFHLSIV